MGIKNRVNMLVRSGLTALPVCSLAMLAACGGGGDYGSDGGSSGYGGGGGENGAIALAWDASSEPNLAGYRLYHGTTQYVYSDWVDVSTATPSGTPPTVTFTLTGLTQGQTYYIVATAYDSQNGQSDPSDEVSAVAQ